MNQMLPIAGFRRRSQPTSGLGANYTMTLQTPYGAQDFTVKMPYEDLLKQAMEAAAAQGGAAALPLLQQMLPEVMAIALPIASNYIEHTFWPNVGRPLMQQEIDKAMAKAEVKINKVVDDTTKKVAIAGGLVILGMFGAAFFVMRKRG